MPLIYMLGTDISSYAMRNYHQALWLKLRSISPATICISAVTAAELLQGTRPYPVRHPMHAAVRQFLGGIKVIPWDLQAAEAFADIVYSLSRSGQSIGHFDMMIAAHALSCDVTLVTNNVRHYSRVSPPLRVENWTEE